MQPYDEMIALFREGRLLDSIGSVLGWDERTYMPPNGSPHRAEQMALVARLTHEKITSPRLGELIDIVAESKEAKSDPNSDQAVNAREMRRTRDRAVKMPASLVEELARTTTRAQNVWQEARKNNDFSSFAPWLDKIVKLKQQEAAAVGHGGVPYDALLDEYEPAATTAHITQVFRDLRQELVPLVDRIAGSKRKPKRDILHREYAVERQASFGKAAAAAIGFDFDSGRLDTTVHPFCSGIGPGDCRLTTRYNPRHFNEAFFGILHEAGHGIYEQGLDASRFGTPLGSAVSLGIHESQSRLWENQVGRSLPFWQHFFPQLQKTFPGTVDDVSIGDFVWAINDVERSFIRVEADEATYNLHIILRFELEQALVSGDLPPADVPGAWNEKFRQMFGLTPPSHSQGCLQDIHWSMGGIGYFPTYALGNLYAAQFMARARRDLGGGDELDALFRKGDFTWLKRWLNDKIHVKGQRFPPSQLCELVTGAPLSHRPLMEYLWKKYDALYG